MIRRMYREGENGNSLDPTVENKACSSEIGCIDDSGEMSDLEKSHVYRLEGKYLDRAIKMADYSWFIPSVIYGTSSPTDKGKCSFYAIGDLIWSQEHSEDEILKYRVRKDHYAYFDIDENDNLCDESECIDESFENIRKEAYDYAAKVNDQDGKTFDIRDEVVCIENGKLARCIVKGFNPETLEYELFHYRPKTTLYRKGTDVLLVNYYGC